MARVATALFAGAAAELSWEEYKLTYDKVYNGDEEARKAVYEANVKIIESTNGQKLSYTFGVNRFTDLTAEEFAASYTNAVPSNLDLPMLEVQATDDIADAFDWRQNGFTNHVKDQGQCGSCWSFSIVGALEGAGLKETGKLVRLSEQQLVDCAVKSAGAKNQGCSGGFMGETMEWMLSHKHWLEYEEDYPYKHKNQACSHQKANEVLTFSNVYKVAQDESASGMGGAVVQHGPLSVAVAAGQWQSYQSGVFSGCPAHEQINHGVTLIGYGSEGSAQYWIIRNSWGSGWGEIGHMRLARGKQMCNVQSQPVTVIGVAIDSSRPQPPEPVPGPFCCETQNVAVQADCKKYCEAHGTKMRSWGTPGPHCGCQDSNYHCGPYPDCAKSTVV